MTGVGHGLLIGKFYPPHAGHHDAIRTAAAQCARVTVVVMASAVETIPLADRVAWLRAEHADEENVRVVGIPCDAPLDVDDEQVWRAQVALMSAAVATVTVEPVDVVFSAEDYGHDLARRFDAKFGQMSRPHGRRSGTSVRRDLAGAWDVLAPASRAGLTTRVIVVGAESTGTTTISRLVAEHYRGRGGAWARTGWVAEYGREYTEVKWHDSKAAARSAGEPEPALDELVWAHDDFDRVAREQTRREERSARAGSPLLVCDTDAFATAVWERRYLAGCARADLPWSVPPQLPRRDLYLLTDHVGVPWDDDGLREGDLGLRSAMTGWFADALTDAGHSWVLLSGTVDQRASLAIRTVDQLLEHRMRFAPPLTGPGFDG